MTKVLNDDKMRTAAEMKDARPKVAFECHFEKDQKSTSVYIDLIEVSNWTWLDAVEDEGYDDALGPCYWRHTSHDYYSTIHHRGRTYLVIYPEWDGNFETCAIPEMAVRRYLDRLP